MTTKTEAKSKTQTINLKPLAKPKKATGNKLQATRSSSSGKPSQSSVRAGTKQALLIDLLKRKKGATLEEAMAATGWQAHSVRGAISGTLKKKLGLTVASTLVDRRGRVYQIEGARLP